MTGFLSRFLRWAKGGEAKAPRPPRSGPRARARAPSIGTHDQTLVVVTGRKGAGKSTLLRTLVLEGAASGVRFHVWDTTREWAPAPGVLIYPRDWWPDLEAVAQRALEDAPSVLVADEIDRVLVNHPSSLPQDSALWQVVNCGRHVKVGLLCAFRRSGRVNTDLVALADVAYLGWTTHEEDVKGVAKAVGVSRELVAGIAPGEFERVEP